MAISTYKIFLMQKKEAAWEKLIDIKEFPDLGGTPEMLETTTLTDRMQTYIPGIQSLDALEFTSNYTWTSTRSSRLWTVSRTITLSGLAALNPVIPLPLPGLTASSSSRVSSPSSLSAAV